MDIITKAITTDGTKKSVPSIQSPYYFLERSYVVGAIKCSWWFERRRLFGNVPQTRYSPFLVNFSHFNKYRWSPWKLFLCVFVSTEGLVLSSLEDSNKGNLSRLCGLNFADSLKKVTNRSCVVGKLLANVIYSEQCNVHYPDFCALKICVPNTSKQPQWKAAPHARFIATRRQRFKLGFK